ncbi:copper/zinc superoxide dismutase [Desulfuromonas soudanensis]|uniref:Superoxide dismutase [Cu-Zn] n=1 Tax=Desulfuromonas soudanensis TaxID=1603606 RepID=A0A0M4DF79_9BACT|nr:copper/zinc superoxide dismutase [Desulfuromonas soudanensis]
MRRSYVRKNPRVQVRQRWSLPFLIGMLLPLATCKKEKAHLEIVDQFLSLEGPDAIVGKTVIVHAQPDDLSSQPTGNAGPRVACGVIEGKG